MGTEFRVFVAVLAVAIPAAAHHGHQDFGAEPAGTIASFDESSGVLTIDLAGGGSVSGLVSHWTRLDCGHPSWSGSWHSGDRGHRVRARHGDDHGHHWGDPSCTTAALTTGATVENAVLGLYFAVSQSGPTPTSTSSGGSSW